METYLRKGSGMLQWAARSWFVLFFAGQVIFAAYIFLQYWGSFFSGRFERWNMATPGLYVYGAPLRSALFGVHAVVAGVVTLLGPLQVISALRRYAPRVHRFLGRVYVFFAFAIGLDGIVLAWRPGAVGGGLDHVIISINAVIIMICAFFTIRTAIRRDVPAHGRWAVHLLLAMSGVWLFRVFLMLWLMVWRAPVGFDPESFTGPFLVVLSVLVYIFPQVFVWGYFRARRSGAVGFSLLLFLITVGMAIGIFAATMGLWLPRMMR
ncbi:MAG: DUF2306 domain-containing protein [Bacteroidetes bacterium]|nr:DUF2306 domain-containing protein [Bacteroidota bacterium]